MEKKKQASGIQKAWRQLSIQNQIFLSMFLITLLGVGVLMNIVYKASVDAIEQNYRASYQSTLKNHAVAGYESEKHCGCYEAFSI